MTWHQFDILQKLQHICRIRQLFGRRDKTVVVTKQAEIELAGQAAAKDRPPLDGKVVIDGGDDTRSEKAEGARMMVWVVKSAWRRLKAWRRSTNPELRELDAFRKCRRLERKLSVYPRAVPLLTELMRAYRETGEEERRLEVMRRLRDIEPRPVPDFMWDEQPPVAVVRNNVEAWCARIERIVRERHMGSIHIQHIQNVLRVSSGNATMVCDALVNRGLLGPYDMSTGRYAVM